MQKIFVNCKTRYVQVHEMYFQIFTDESNWKNLLVVFIKSLLSNDNQWISYVFKKEIIAWY